MNSSVNIMLELPSYGDLCIPCRLGYDGDRQEAENGAGRLCYLLAQAEIGATQVPAAPTCVPNDCCSVGCTRSPADRSVRG